MNHILDAVRPPYGIYITFIGTIKNSYIAKTPYKRICDVSLYIRLHTNFNVQDTGHWLVVVTLSGLASYSNRPIEWNVLLDIVKAIT